MGTKVVGRHPTRQQAGCTSALRGDPESTPRTRPRDEAEAARERIITMLGPSPVALDELAGPVEARRVERVPLLELELAGRVRYLGDQGRERQQKREPRGFSIDRIVLVFGPAR